MFKSRYVLLVAFFILSGCVRHYWSQHTTYPDGRHEVKVYTSIFYSDSRVLAEKAEIALSVVNTRRIEPITYTLAEIFSALGPDDLYSKATTVVHFKNDSPQIHHVVLQKIRILNTDHIVRKNSDIILKPADRFDTKRIKVVIPTYDTEFDLELFYSLNGRDYSMIFLMKRQTVEDMKKLEAESKIPKSLAGKLLW